MKSIDEFLALLNAIPAGPNAANKWKARCPAHRDGDHKENWSLSIAIEGDKILLKCFAGCKTPDIVKTLGLKMNDLFIGEKEKKTTAEKKPARVKGKIVATYQYLDIGNKLIFEVVRYEPKSFRQRRPDGQGGYHWDLNGIERVIYRLPLILAAIGRGETIFHVEGEKDVDNLVKLGLEATTSPQGASSWKASMAGYYNNAKTVVIIPDKDDAGRAYAREVARDIFTHVGAVKMLELPGEGIKDASDWIAAGGTAAQLQAMVKNLPDWQMPQSEAGAIDYEDINKTLKNASAGMYVVKDQRFQRIVHAKDEIYEYPLCNFVARVIQDIVKDSGATVERFLRIQARLNGSHLPTVTVPDNQFDNMTWVRREWGVKAQLERSIDKVERHVNQAVIKSSGRVPEKVIYTHTGWREIDGQMVYLTASGAVGRPDIEVELPTNLARYQLPQPDGDPREAIKKSFELLNVAEINVTLPVLILPYLSVLNVFEDINFTPWLIGRSGSLKSVMSALALSHFGNFTEKTLPANWFGTRTELEKLAFHAKDILFNIDDFAPPSGNAQKKELNNTAEYILRAYGNRQARVRSRADLSSQVTFIPRGLLLSSGEEMPAAGVSRSARTLPIPISKESFKHGDDLDYTALTQAQKDRLLYPLAMAHYIAWIQRNWKTVSVSFHENFTSYRALAPKNTDTHLRLIDAVSMMQTGYLVMSDFALDMGVITQSEYDERLLQSWDILTGLLDYQSSRISSERPGERFIEILKSAIAAGKALLRRPYLDDWTPKEAGPNQSLIGWDDKDNNTVYLEPKISTAIVNKQCNDMGEYFSSSQEATLKDMDNLGYLKATGLDTNRTYLFRKRFGGPQIWAICLKREVLFGDE